MPKSKVILFSTLLLIALGIATELLARGALDDEKVTSLLISAMLTFFILSLVELVPEVARYVNEWSEGGRFRRFFGVAAAKDAVRMVFANRHLDPGLAVDPWITWHQVPGRHVAEGAHDWLAVQDIRAAAYLSSMLSKFTPNDLKFIQDKDIDYDDFDYCTISLGLGFNGFTRRVARWCNDDLFEIKWGASVKSSALSTDFFAVGRDRYIPVTPTGTDDCIVARVVPRTETGKAKRVAFVCAGRTAAGTAAAGFFLAKRWQQIQSLYRLHGKDLDVDSVVVVVHHAEPSGIQEYDSNVEIASDGSGQIIRWGKVAGF
jgi:hypothetical protein